jgi:hypothetical protein
LYQDNPGPWLNLSRHIAGTYLALPCRNPKIISTTTASDDLPSSRLVVANCNGLCIDSSLISITQQCPGTGINVYYVGDNGNGIVFMFVHR